MTVVAINSGQPIHFTERMILLSHAYMNIAAVHDLSGFGRCSLTAAIPILSAMGIHCCPLPTAILSNQTGFEDFSYLDFTPFMADYIAHWKKRGIEFDAIYSGFLGGEEQVDIVIDLIRTMRQPGTRIAVDPVLGDNGRKYPTFSDSMCARMRKLVEHADIVFPNLTEALLLTGSRLPLEKLREADISAMASDISAAGPRQIVITGAVCDDTVTNYIFDFAASQRLTISSAYNHQSYSGTGDIFASIVCGCLTRGEALPDAAKTAAAFIKKTVDYTEEKGTDNREGILFEPFLKELA